MKKTTMAALKMTMMTMKKTTDTPSAFVSGEGFDLDILFIHTASSKHCGAPGDPPNPHCLLLPLACSELRSLTT